MKTKGDVYERLRREINTMPIPMPATESGTELRLLRHLFTPEEAEVAMNLSVVAEPLGRIYRRVRKSGISITRDELEKTLDTLVDKGAISVERKGSNRYYSKAQLAIGMFEFQVNRITPEYTRDFEEYMESGFLKTVFAAKTSQMRTIPIRSTLRRDITIETYNNAREIIRKWKGDIAVMNCVCRQSREALGLHCGVSGIRETCLINGTPGSFFIERGDARPITAEEALQIVSRAEEAGFVLQPQNSRNPGFICCCCSDCCHALRALRALPRPAQHVNSAYMAVVDNDSCRGCAKCADLCPMGAISMTDELAVVEPDRCIGCGVCAGSCPEEAVGLEKKRSVRKPPLTGRMLYVKIIRERFGTAGLLGFVMKMLMGKKL